MEQKHDCLSVTDVGMVLDGSFASSETYAVSNWKGSPSNCRCVGKCARVVKQKDEGLRTDTRVLHSFCLTQQLLWPAITRKKKNVELTMFAFATQFTNKQLENSLTAEKYLMQSAL